MYTQCPDCSAAFRVTAEVLKQAAGKVRCGGCGIAFNALEHLSEEKPEAATPPAPRDPQLPELTPDAPPDNDSPPPPPPAAITPEQSAALRQTLGKLSENDIKLEDTGIEWRVTGDAAHDSDADTQSREIDSELLDLELPGSDDGNGDGAADALAEVFVDDGKDTLLDAELSASLAEQNVDEVLSSSPTPIDEILGDDNRTTVDSADVFDESPAEEVLRFDDNTGLPDDFGLDDDLDNREPAAPVVPEPADEAPPLMTDVEVDLGFENPDEWQDLLEEVEPAPAESADGLAELPVVDRQALAAAATVIQTNDQTNDNWEDPAAEEAAVGEMPSESEESAAATDAAGTKTLAEELEALEIELPDDGSQELPPGEELANQMEALSLELSGLQESLDILAEESPEPGIIDELNALEIDLDEQADPAIAERDEATEALAADESTGNAENEATTDEPLLLEEDVREENVPEDSGVAEEAAESEAGDADDAREADELPENLALVADPPESVSDEEETSIDEDLVAAAFESEAANEAAGGAEADGGEEHYVPPPTEEEETINRLIDQELMALAVEDEDGFASTIVVDESAFEPQHTVDEAGGEDRQTPLPILDDIENIDSSGTVETIVMEGDLSHSGEGFADIVTEETPLPDEAAMLAAAADADAARPPNWRAIAGISALVVVLLIQAVHFSRDALATSPAISGVLASVYDAIGLPLTPAWDVTGWRFEATRGSTDESGDTLSIYSRIGNKAEVALPYPVISVSLTDRFEETIGSRVLGPAEYLAEDLDTSSLVKPGTSFNAQISIESPVAEATGFKLNVCYRLEQQQLRCAIEDFK
ncbi:MAG: DUF3426 domain-containing protein [Pseudomonadota bacterium]